MDNYTPNSFMTQPIYDPTHPFATSSWEEDNNGGRERERYASVI